MPPAEFEPATPLSDRPQTITLDRLATGIDEIGSPDRPARNQSLPRPTIVNPLLLKLAADHNKFVSAHAIKPRRRVEV